MTSRGQRTDFGDADTKIVAIRGDRQLDVTEMVRFVFDLAVHSMDHGSGFWDLEDCQQARRLAVVLGADPDDVAHKKYLWAANWPDPDESVVRSALGYA